MTNQSTFQQSGQKGVEHPTTTWLLWCLGWYRARANITIESYATVRVHCEDSRLLTRYGFVGFGLFGHQRHSLVGGHDSILQ